jgi:hypothetical protein
MVVLGKCNVFSVMCNPKHKLPLASARGFWNGFIREAPKNINIVGCWEIAI